MALGTSLAIISYGSGFLIAYHGRDGNLITTGNFSDGLVPTGPHEWFQPMVDGTSPSIVNDDNGLVGLSRREAGGPDGVVVCEESAPARTQKPSNHPDQ
jgi:hypothetical protein